jgi:hypothetical protein
MNYNHPEQIKALINQLNLNNSQIKQINEKEDPEIGELFNYIKEPKKIINFINSNHIMYSIRIPCFITKSDLYTIADLYKGLTFTNIILIHNYNILNKDDSSIEDISDGDNIIIIEDRNYPEESYYWSIYKKYENREDKINIFFDGGASYLMKKNFIFSREATMYEMLNSIYLFYGYDRRDLRIVCDVKTLEPGETKIGEMFKYNSILIGLKIEDMRKKTECRFLGQIISAKLLIDGKNIEVKVGRLNNTKVLFCPDRDHGFGIYRENLRNLYNIYIKKFDVEIKYEDDQSFYSLGIKEDFECVLKKK